MAQIRLKHFRWIVKGDKLGMVRIDLANSYNDVGDTSVIPNYALIVHSTCRCEVARGHFEGSFPVRSGQGSLIRCSCAVGLLEPLVCMQLCSN